MYVLGIMYNKTLRFRKLDSTVITKSEFDNMVVWNERLHTQDLSKLSRVSKKYYEQVGMVNKPPPKADDEEAGASK